VSPGCGEITIGIQQILGSLEPGRSLSPFVISPRLEQRAHCRRSARPWCGGLGGRLSVHEQLFCATAPRRAQRGAGDSPSPVLVSARTCSCRSPFR
jgi:hypothetical protein